MPSKLLSVEQALTQLAATPARITELTTGLTPAQLHTKPGPDEWSANDVLAHLRACADVWGNNIHAILTEDRPTRRGVDPRNWMKETDYLELEFRPSLRSFSRQRADLLARLQPLSREGWSRAAMVTAWGMAYERTILYYADRIARHERSHVKQIARLAASIQT